MKGQKGVTLVELVMVMVIVMVLAFMLGDALVAGVRAYLFTSDRNEALEQGRTAAEMIARELRNSVSITTATVTEVCFIDVLGTTVSFRYSGGNVLREEIAAGPPGCPGTGGNVLSSYITSLSFSYLQANGAPDPAPPANTERIRMTLTSTVSDAAVDLTTEVGPRNF